MFVSIWNKITVSATWPPIVFESVPNIFIDVCAETVEDQKRCSVEQSSFIILKFQQNQTKPELNIIRFFCHLASLLELTKEAKDTNITRTDVLVKKIQDYCLRAEN